jgi:coproporphyrinogen III oxidase
MPSSSALPGTLPAVTLVESLQARLVARLEGLHPPSPMKRVEWLRREGNNGGGCRYEFVDNAVFNRASVNVSHVFYDDDEGPLRAATALSSIIHPAHPRAPSLHLHISWTEQRHHAGTWRIMADLNPSMPNANDTDRFSRVVVDAFTAGAGADVAALAVAQGDRYFAIPALERRRGVFHTYLEGHRSDDAAKDAFVARAIGEAVIDGYAAIVSDVLGAVGPVTDDERAAQLAYHTVYLFQVLTLDRGTTSGLLVHDENDGGIMGSLPSRVDRALLASWAEKVPAVQRPLVLALVDALPEQHPCAVDTPTRLALARVVRAHYQSHPEALELQAR